MRSAVRRHPVATYIAITYAVTWSAWIALAATGRVVTIGGDPVFLAGLLGPLCGAVATTAMVAGWAGLRDLGARMVRVRAGAGAWALAVGVPLAIGLPWLVGARWDDLGRFNGYPAMSPPILWLAIFVVNGFGEETGWRGLLWPTLARRRSPLVASLGVGVVWCVWHVPAFWIGETYRAMPTAVIPMFFLGVMSGAIVLGWLYQHARQSILVCAAFHATFNLLSGSVASRGVLAAVESTATMLAASAIVVAALVHRLGHRIASRMTINVITPTTPPASATKPVTRERLS